MTEKDLESARSVLAEEAEEDRDEPLPKMRIVECDAEECCSWKSGQIGGDE